MYFSIVVLVLTKTLVTEVCHTLNVTVTPGPLVLVAERDNLTLSCLVSERKWSSSVLILRWFFSPLTRPTVSPSPVKSTTPTALPSSQFLIVRIGIKKMQQYGNYSRRFPQPKFRLFEDAVGEVYRLLISNVTGMDEGFYSCKVQEIRRFRTTWRASSNGTSTTQLTGGIRCTYIVECDSSPQAFPSQNSDLTQPTVSLCQWFGYFQKPLSLSAPLVQFTPEDGSRQGLLVLFSDVYLWVVWTCSLGLLCIFLFSLVFTWQSFLRRHRLKASYLFIKCPESSSGETVTSSSSCSSSPQRKQRKESRQQIDRGQTVTPLKLPEEPLFQPPVKTEPDAAKRPQKPRRLKIQPRRSANSGVSHEDSLTYAELELVRPRQEPPASSSHDATPSSPDTVYAQILFQDDKQ